MTNAQYSEDQQQEPTNRRACSILNTQADPALNGLVELAARVSGAPLALISLVEEDRSWSMPEHDAGPSQAMGRDSISEHAILSGGPLVISDTTQDPRTADSDLVIGERAVRFYAGVPLILTTGEAIGALCVTDSKPRNITEDALASLSLLAQQASALLELRRDASRQREARAELRTILDAVPSRIYYKDARNHILNLNRAAAATIGMSIEDIKGRPAGDFFSDLDATAFSHDEAQVLSTGKPKLGIEETHEASDGHRKTISTDKINLRNGRDEFDRLVSIETDITELHDAQDQLALAHKRLELALEGAGQAAWDWDVLTHQVVYSDTWYTMLGYEPNELPMTFDTWESLVHPDDLEPAFAGMDDYLAGNGDIYSSTIRMRCKTGDWRWIRTIGKACRWDEEGSPIRITGMHIDIDAERRLQDKLTQKNAELERFVYTASHDLKSPIVTIMGFASHLIESCESGDVDTALEHAGRISRAGKRMRDCIDDLLRISRIGNAKSSRSRVSLSEVIRDVLDQHQDELTRCQAHVSIELNADTVLCDPIHVQQVIENLVNNALRYGLTHQEPKLTLRSETLHGNQVQISVIDNGTGVERAYAEKIFELFERLSASKDGSGLGLAIVRRFAQLYEGDAWVTDAPGSGAAFHISLPAEVNIDHSNREKAVA